MLTILPWTLSNANTDKRALVVLERVHRQRTTKPYRKTDTLLLLRSYIFIGCEYFFYGCVERESRGLEKDSCARAVERNEPRKREKETLSP